MKLKGSALQDKLMVVSIILSVVSAFVHDFLLLFISLGLAIFAAIIEVIENREEKRKEYKEKGMTEEEIEKAVNDYFYFHKKMEQRLSKSAENKNYSK